MFEDGSLTFREFVMSEPLPLAMIQSSVLDFLRGRTDAVLFGAQAVNAYVDEPRMTQDIDILSTRAAQLADEIREFLSQRFQIAVRIQTVANGLGHRVYQIHKPNNRHLVDVRSVEHLPYSRLVGDVLVIAPVELVGLKVLSMVGRLGTAKGLIDQADILRLLAAFPELRTKEGEVAESLNKSGAPSTVLSAWQEILSRPIVEEDEY